MGQDLRYALRMLARSPGFTAVAVLALALGIGANTAIFTLVNAYMLRPLPFPDSDRLAMVRNIRDPAHRVTRGALWSDYLAWRCAVRSFEASAACRFVLDNLSVAREPEMVRGVAVSAGFFDLLQVRPRLGRAFLTEEDAPAARRVVILSHGLWQRKLGGRPNVLGSTLEIDGHPHTIVGVMPADFRFPSVEFQFWAPLRLDPAPGGKPEGVVVFGRLRPDASLASAGQELAALLPESGQRVRMISLYEEMNHLRHARPPLLVLLTSVGFVLLIACANVANLLLSRAVSRAKEIAIRTTLGAGRFRILRQMLVESLVLAGGGGALGLVLGITGVRLLFAVTPAYMQPLGGVEADRSVLFFTAIVAMLAAVLFGTAPALQTLRPQLIETLKEGGRSSAAAGRGWLRRALVVAEVAPALVLLIGAGLLMKSFARIQSADLGFHPENVLKMDLLLSPLKYAASGPRVLFYDEALARIGRVPGVVAAGLTNGFWSGGMRAIAPEGVAPSPDRKEFAACRLISPDYLRAMGIRLDAGRTFDSRDTAASLPVAIVNETMAKRYWAGAALGRTVRFTAAEHAGRGPLTIVGVAGDNRQHMLGSVDPEVYIPYAQEPPPVATIVVRTAGAPEAIASAVRGEIHALDPGQPVSQVQSMEEHLADTVAPQRITMQLLGVFAAVALALSVVGLYGVIAYYVSQRTHEFGIRMALGASRVEMLGLVVRQGAALAAIGIGLGLAIAFGVTRLMSVLLFGVEPTDPVIFTAVPALLGAVALAASYIPAYRAARLDPVQALREE